LKVPNVKEQTMSASHHLADPARYARQAGIAAVLAGTLLFAGVVGPLVIDVQASDGSILSPFPFSLFVGSFTIGSALLVLALLALRSLHRASGEELPRSGRVGARVSLIGASLLTAFGIVHLATALVTGTPAEGSFILFGFGMLLIIVGHVALSVGLYRSGVLRSWSLAPLAAAGGVLVAIVVPTDLWHHMGLFFFDAGWVALGAHLIVRSRRREAPTTRSREAVRSA
jgi:hypothetical protein